MDVSRKSSGKSGFVQIYANNQKEVTIFVFYDRFVELCKIKGVSPSAATHDIGLNNSSSTAWKRGSIPKSDTLQKLADYFQVSVDYLLGQYHLKGILDYKVGDIRQRIFKGIEQIGVSYEEFCEELGLPFDEWFRWKEASSESYLDYLPQIAQLLGISEEELSRGYKKSIPITLQLKTALSKLNVDGQQEAVKRVEELTEIPRYRAQTAPQAPSPPPEGTDTTPPENAPETLPEGE